MRAKKLGRSELLNWINGITSSDYAKIENLSDGVGLCQVIDAFFNNVSPEMFKVKMNSKNKEDWQKNFNLLNEMLSKQKSYKQIDPIKLTKSNFSINFEFLQFLYDFIYKTFNTSQPKKYNGLLRRIEIIKAQYGQRAANDIKKYLPPHLLTNEVLLQIDKEKYFGDSLSSSSIINNQASIEKDFISSKMEKYRLFFKLLEEDLKRISEINAKLKEDTEYIQEEGDFYLNKAKTILDYCEQKKEKDQDSEILNSVIEIIKREPEEFK